MKYLLFLFAFLFCIFPKVEVKDSLNQSVIDSKIESLEKKVVKLESDNFAKDLIQEYKDLNNLYSIGFVILISLFGIAFPLLLYIIQIRPSQEVLKEAKQLIKKVDENFEESFEEHLKKSKNKLINEAIEAFEREFPHNLPTSYTLLDTYKSEGFTEVQVVKLLKLLRRDDLDNGNKDFIASILTFQEDKNTEHYFADLIHSNPNDSKSIWGAIYFSRYNKTQYYDLIAKIVISGYDLKKMINSLSHSSKTFALQLLNNELLVKELDLTEIKTYGQYGAKYLMEKINREAVENTLFWKKFLEL